MSGNAREGTNDGMGTTWGIIDGKPESEWAEEHATPNCASNSLGTICFQNWNVPHLMFHFLLLGYFSANLVFPADLADRKDICHLSHFSLGFPTTKRRKKSTEIGKRAAHSDSRLPVVLVTKVLSGSKVTNRSELYFHFILKTCRLQRNECLAILYS